MDETIISAIASVGFPIVMCILMFYYVQQESKNHKEEVDALKETITNNTLTLQKLIDKMDK